MSPWVDLTLSGASMATKADADVVCSQELLDRSAEWYAAGADRGAPLLSPLFADLGGLPPLLVLVGTDEVLLDDATRLASRASDAGVEVEIDVEDQLLHVYPMFPGVPEADRALVRMGDWIADR
jgi:acetyl esterase/lipase